MLCLRSISSDFGQAQSQGLNSLAAGAKYYISRPSLVYCTSPFDGGPNPLYSPPAAVHGPSALANMLLNWLTAIGARTLEELEQELAPGHEQEQQLGSVA